MTARAKRPRQYLKYLEASKKAMLSAIDSFNRVFGDYKTEMTLMLLSNAWELLAKAVLLKKGQKIYEGKSKERTISCEIAVEKLRTLKILTEDQADLVQQIVSLRNKCSHDILPSVPDEIQHHLLFFGCKFFKGVIAEIFPGKEVDLNQNFLTLSFDHLATYASEVQRLISTLRRGSQDDKELIWLLERGVRFAENSQYISQDKFERLYKDKKKISPHLKLGTHIEETDMVRIVPVQAPKNYSADIILRKGAKNTKEALPVLLKKTDVEEDYPYLTKDLVKKIGKNQNFISRTITDLKLKDNPTYHQAVRTSGKTFVQKYSKATLEALEKHFTENPDYTPYRKAA